jgi:hypothetical protein
VLYWVKPSVLRMGGLTLGEADKQVGQCLVAGSNSYRGSVSKVLAWLAAYPMALGPFASRFSQLTTSHFRSSHRCPNLLHCSYVHSPRCAF